MSDEENNLIVNVEEIKAASPSLLSGEHLLKQIEFPPRVYTRLWKRLKDEKSLNDYELYLKMQNLENTLWNGSQQSTSEYGMEEQAEMQKFLKKERQRKYRLIRTRELLRQGRTIYSLKIKAKRRQLQNHGLEVKKVIFPLPKSPESDG